MVQHLWIQQTTFQICIAVYVFFPMIFSFVSYAHFTTGFSFLLTCRNSLHILNPNWRGGGGCLFFQPCLQRAEVPWPGIHSTATGRAPAVMLDPSRQELLLILLFFFFLGFMG